ncbi:MAG: HDIG domain-containing metalloprotein, partial [Chloroflexota bacterium]
SFVRRPRGPHLRHDFPDGSGDLRLVQLLRTLTTNETAVVSDLVHGLAVPNLVPDEAATDRLKKTAVESAPPVFLNLSRGETIVPDGQIITPLSLEKLGAAGMLNAAFEWERVVGTALLSTTLSGFIGLYLLVVQPSSLSNRRRLLLLGLVLVGTVMAAKFALPGRPVWAVAFPIAAAGMVLTGLLQLSVALVCNVFLAILVGYTADFVQGAPITASLGPLDTMEKLAFYLVTGSVAGIAVWRAQRISQYFFAGGISALAGLLVVAAFWLLTPQRELLDLALLTAADLGGGLLSAALALGLFVLLGQVFDITTRVQLHELAQADHPLLKQLLQEAPGTYYHSLLVGNLAEQACEAIGADALLARVGAYYHDVGKVQNPGFFIENQRQGENVHDRLDPLTSASVIIAHVADGLRMAQATRLPHRIHDFIREHHGNRLAIAFYNKATHLNARVNPDLFRYPGPAPQTRETAVVMLADSLEAISRSAGLQAPEELDGLVERVVAERTAEGQLSNCDLTLRDVEQIKGVFKSALRGIYHPRVQYPTPAAAPAGMGVTPIEAARRLAVVGDQQPGDFC